ncbi:EF hand protein (macronuclear) [Tetrahymena thermophila SB210]|uniref:EF hand protein n=1 Tax=Tetrahymena thermophila (strain SB210) TaxID=312017 RepID=Q23CW2_TETTS|nr:EF hand protein [Tetrahymena thermophila SB210]EAR94381.2 EF hand protein [Tetrahymena thermophila SB210]|eukprot:XP_001014924.2 EF hand protein [Tetrahymena thermophila SB210]
MNSKGFNKLQKSVKFDPAATIKSEYIDDLRDSQVPSGKIFDHLQNSQMSYSNSSKRFQQLEDNESSIIAKELVQSQKTQSLKRFIQSDDPHKELNSQLKQSLMFTQQEKKQEANSKKIIDRISQKEIYPETSNPTEEIGDKSLGGLKLDDKTLLEECFINFHGLIKIHRFKIAAMLLNYEKNSRQPALNVTFKIGMSDELFESLKLKRANAWRGFVRKEDLYSVMKNFGFFEAVSPRIFDQYIEKVKCLDRKYNWINYVRLIASVTRYKSSISHLTKKFLMIDLKNGNKRVRTFRKYDEAAAGILILQKYREYRARLAFKAEQKRKQEEEKKLKKLDEPLSETDKLKLSMNQSADNLIGILREKIAQSHRSLKDIFRMLDSDNDSYISKEEFKLAFKKANIKVEEQILDEAYFRFDFNKDDKVSFNEFLNVILGQEKKVVTNAFQLQSVAEDVITEIRKIMLSRFNNRRLFLESVSARNFNKITEDEFCAFVSQFTNNEFSRIQMKTVFSYLDRDGKRNLKQEEFLEIYEHQVQKEEINQNLLIEQQKKEREKKLREQQEEEEFENEAKSFYEQNVDKSQLSRVEYLTKLHSQANEDYQGQADEKFKKNLIKKLMTQSQEQIEEEISTQERRKQAKEARARTQIFLKRQQELENVMKVLSDQVHDKLEKTNKTLRDLFNIFSQKQFGYLDQEEFIILINFMCKQTKLGEDVVKALFFLFANYYSKKLSFKLFEKLIENGQNLNTLYLKFKFRFGNKLDRLKKKIIEDFQRLDVSQGQWMITFDDFKKILELNQIPFTSTDEKQLIKDKVLQQVENNIYVNYKKLLPIIFPSNTQIQQDIFARHSKTITRFFKLFKLKKQRKQMQEELEKQKAAQKKGGAKDNKRLTFGKSSKGGAKDRKSTSKGPSGNLKKSGINAIKEEAHEEVNDLKRVGEFMRPKELTDFFQDDQIASSQVKKQESDQAQAKAGTSSIKGTGKKGKAPEKNPLSKQLEEAIPDKKGTGTSEQQFQQQQKNKNIEMCQNILEDLIEKAVGFGESLVLSKEIQKKYEERPVLKDVFVCLKDFEAENIDILPKCIFTSTQTGRVMVLDKQSHLHQYDMCSKKKLIELDLSVKVPLCEAYALDATFDQNSGRLYILTDKWNIEVWELGQDNSSPLGQIVLFSANTDTQKAINTCYGRRFQNAFPDFIQLSQHSHQVIVVNSTCINNSLIFVDPISLCVFNILYISPSDFRMSHKLSDMISKISLKLLECQQKGVTFEDIFQGKIKKESEDSLAVNIDDFKDTMFNIFGKDLEDYSRNDWNDLVEFLDQNNSGFIDKEEFEFLYEMIKYHSVKIPDQTEQLIKLAGISEGAFNLLNSLARFLQRQRKSIEDAFKAFDSDGLGTISCQEFEYILQRVCKGDDNLKYSNELIQFIDRDKNGMIDFQEFSLILGIASENHTQGIQFNNRKNLMLCFQKAYEAGIDVEEMLIKEDPYQEGTISTQHFRNILKWLPVGINEEELDSIMKTSITYSDNGSVNYIKLLTSTQFKSIKEQYRFKKSFASQKSFVEYNEVNTQEKRELDLVTQKVIIESVLYLDDFDLIVYTTACPRTSIIFVSKSNRAPAQQSDLKSKNKKIQQPKSDVELFTNKLLAKLQGHKTCNAPSIAYVPQSGCLISGEKLHRNIYKEKDENPHLLNNAFSQFQFEKDEKIIEFDKNRSADILIWNIQKELFSKFETNPPWVIQPTRVIESAHYDSIISFTYLPYCQLVASSSADNTIKLWNPIARPYSLVNQDGEASVEIKPGYYKKRKQEYTITNEPFCEVRRIYTGDQTCYGISSFTARIPVLSNPEIAGDQPGKRMNIIEVLITCNIQKTELINKKPRNPCSVRIYSVDKMQIEVPCNRHDEVIPRKFYEQLESLSIERRKKAYVNYQMFLPTQLEVMKSKKTLQQAALKKMIHLLKKISLTRFDDLQKYVVDEDVETLFQVFIKLPSRQAFSAFMSDYDVKNKITANELFYYLKKFNNLHPLNIQRDKFFDLCKQFKSRSKKGLFNTNSSDQNDLEKQISHQIRKKGLNFYDEFSKASSAEYEEAKGLTQENIIISKDDFLQMLHKLSLYTTEQDFVIFMAQVDPLFSNKVSSNVLIDKFSSDIIEYKLSQIQRPKELIEQLMNKFNQKQRVKLMFSLSAVDSIADGYLSQKDFLFAFDYAGLTVNKSLIEEIFQFYAEKFSEEDPTKVLSVKYITKKLFSANENLGMLKYLHSLGKIKSCLLDQGYPLEYIYRPMTKEEADPNAVSQANKNFSDNYSEAQSIQLASRKKNFQESGVKKSPVANPLMQIGVQMFINRIEQLQIANISSREIKSLADFLSISDDQTQSPTVTLSHYLHYMRKINTKSQYLLVQEHKNIYNEINSLLNKQEDLLQWKDKYRKELFNSAELRYILGKSDVSGDYIDEIIIQFVSDKNQISLEDLFTRFQDYINEKPMLKNQKQLEILDTNSENAEGVINQQITLGELIFSPKGQPVRSVIIKKRQYLQQLVNYIRTKAPEMIEPLNQACESRDTDKKLEIEISEFCNIIRFTIQDISEDLLINFQREYILENDSNMIEYQDFFNKYASKEEIQKLSQMQYESLLNPSKENIDVNMLIKRIVYAISDSNVNVNYALKFIQNDAGQIPIDELYQFLDLVKVPLNENEKEVLIDFLGEKQGNSFVRSQFFLDQIYICKKGVANQFNQEIWKIASTQIDQYTLDSAKQNQIYIERFVKQKHQQLENSKLVKDKERSELRYPLVWGDTFSLALSEQLQHDFDNKQQGEILAFAIVGSQLTEQEAKNKIQDMHQSEFDIKKEIINMQLFSKGLVEMFNYQQSMKKNNLQSLKSQQSIATNTKIESNNQSLNQSFAANRVLEEQNKQIQYLISKIKGTLKDNGVSLWDALLSTHLSITENSKVPINEFKFIINSLNLKLTLREKLLLIRIADPEETGKCDIQLIIKKIESEEEITDHARHLILEKFSTALFYNDMSLHRAFNLFDEDGDGVISQQEFVIGMKQLNLGLSIFEIKKLMKIIDIDGNEQISKQEFIKVLSEKNQAFNIDPLKDFSLSLLTKIRNMINLKGADLLQAFEEVDTQQRGFIYFKQLKDCLLRFGISNVKSYHILTLYKIYLSKPKPKEQLKDSQMKSSLKKSNFKDNYSLSPMKPSRLGNKEIEQQQMDQITELQSISFIGDEIDQAQIADEKIDYKELCKKILAAVEMQAKSSQEITNDLLRKLYKILEQKRVTLFEAFAYFDVNSTNTISQLELRVGLKNMDVNFPNDDFDRVFKSFEKTPQGKITFNAFFNRFIEAGALQIIKFDDTLENTIKKFAKITTKLGNFEQAFNKLDINGNGQLSIFEFKESCKRLSLGLKHEEIEMVFKSLLNADNLNFKKNYGLRTGDEMEKDDNLTVDLMMGGKENAKTIRYRHFVKLLNQFTSKAQSEQILYKLFKKSQERKINWKLTFQQMSSGGLRTSKTQQQKKPNAVDQVPDISLTQCKNMLTQLKLGLTFEEIDVVVNSFDTITISYNNFMDKTLKAAQKLEDIEYEKNSQLQTIVTGINDYLEKNRVKMAQIFKDFNNIELGKLRLSEFNNIVRFMQIDSNIHSIKLLFNTIDIDGKEYITLSELNNALADTAFYKSKSQQQQKKDQEEQVLSLQERKDAAKLEEIKGQIKIKLTQRQKTLSQEINELGFNENEALNEKNLESLLTSIEVVLKKSDINFFYRQIIKSQQAQAVGNLSFQSFLDFAIRQQIEQITFDETVNFIHPTVAVCIDKVGQLFKRLEIDAAQGFKYLCKAGQQSISRKEFLKIFQAVDKNFTVDELLLIYQYFDEKNYGEIIQDGFVEKFEYIAFTSLTKLNKQNEKEIQDAQKSGVGSKEEDNSHNLQKIKMSIKQQVQGVMQKIFFFMQEKRYNKKQLKAVFDRNGNGILSREEFLEALKLLNLGIPIDKARILLDYIDRDESGRIEIDTFIQDIFESIPQQYKKMYTHGNVIKIMNDIVSKLTNHTANLLQDLVQYERNVRPTEENIAIYKIKTGIQIFDFHKVLKNHGIKLSDNEKDEIKNMFVMSMNTEYYDLEQIYDMIDTIMYQRKQNMQKSKIFLESENVSNIWEQDVYRKIAEYLRKHNLNVEEAFKKIDQDSSGLISSSEFRRFIESLDLDLSEIKIQSLIKGYFNGEDQGTISLSAFKNKFWEAYIRYGRTEINKVINPRIDDLKANKKKILMYIYLTLREFTKGKMERAWAILDQRKIGLFEIEDFRHALVQMGVYLTREELKSAFNFIDTDSDSVVKYLEFVDFWIGGESKLLNGSTDVIEGSESFGGGHNYILDLEESILEHICKVINQREISLWDCFKFFDEEQKGYLTKQQFNDFLQKIGVRVETETKLIQLMRVIDPKQFGESVHLSALESRLSKYGLHIHTKGQVEQIEWIDKPLTLSVVAMSKHLAKSQNLEDFFSEYDSDYDGFLTPNEFYNAFKYISQDMGVLDSAIQRLSHKLASQKSYHQGKIHIGDMCEYLLKLIHETELQMTVTQNQEDLYSNFISVDKPVFQHILLHFDGFSSVFNKLVNIKSSYLQMKKFLSGKKQKIRGFQLISKQNSLLDIHKIFNQIKESLKNGIYGLRRQAQEYINDQICQGSLDPEKNNYAVVDKQKIMGAQTELEITNYRILMDDGMFQKDEGSLRFFTPYIKYYSGFLIQNNYPVDIFVYTKDVLNFTCADGNNFVKILDFELKLHNVLQNKYSFMFKNIGVFLKRVGHELGDIEYMVMNEAIDPAEYISLYDLIQQNGGLFRIPVLVKLRSVTYLLKYIARQILQILQAINNEACFLNILRPENIFINRHTYEIKLANVRGVAKYDLFSKVSMIPDLEFNLVQRVGPLAVVDTQLDYQEYFNAESEFKHFYREQLFLQPYLAPEQILRKTADWNAYSDIWGFGCLLYHILFGQPPKSFYQSLIDRYGDIDKEEFTEPSTFFHYDIYSDELAQEVLRVDYNDNPDSKINLKYIPPSDIAMVKAIDKSTFGNIFNKIFPTAGKEYEREFQQLSEVLDLISACLQYTPSKRPTVEGLLQSPVFQQDNYEVQRSIQLFETVFFYKSPSTTLRERAFDPLRQLCALAIKNPDKLDLYFMDIIRIIDYVHATISVQPNSKIDHIKQESNLGFYGFSQGITTNSFYSSMLPKKMKALLKDSEEQRNKHANSVLVQFLFDNDVLDMLVFLSLRHHKQITLEEIETTQKTSLTKANLNHEYMLVQREKSIRILTALRELMKSLIYQLDSYKSAVAPFVHKLLENLVKFFIGEEYQLQSNMIDILNRSVGSLPDRNLHSEYENTKQNPAIFERFFQRNVDSAVLDDADKLWKEKSLHRPYIFLSKNWTPILYNVVGSLYKSTVGEAGVGKSNYPVLQDYIRFCSDKYNYSEFDIDKKKKILNDQIYSRLPKSADYYNDLINMAENLNILYSSEKIAGTSASLKIVLNYFKSMLRSNNTDKIKLLLDCRAPVYLIPYLNTDDVHVRANLLEIFLEISHGFANINLSYAGQRELKSEEINKNFGIVAHMNQVYEDKLDRKRYIECANNYYYLKQQINKQYLYQLAFCFETPNMITNLFQTFKTKAELINSKILVIRIFQNLVNGPESVVKMLNISSIDVFPSILKLLIKPKQGGTTQEQKTNKILSPVVQEVFKEIVKHARSEIIDILEYTPGIRSLLKEADLTIPQKLNLSTLSIQIKGIKEFYKKEKEQIIHEIKQCYVNPSTIRFKDSLSNLKYLHSQSLICLEHILSWFKHYFFTCKDLQIIVEAKRLVDFATSIARSVIQNLKEYAQFNPIALEIITLYSVFIENISNMGLYYVIFNKNDLDNSKALITWMQNFINYAYSYHEDIEYLSQEESLKKYQENQLTPIAHIFMRILITLTEVDKQYMKQLLNDSGFGKFYLDIVKKQHKLVLAFINTNTENLHVLQYYVEETNFRIVVFENILNSSNEELKDFIMENDFVKYICCSAFQNETEFQVGLYRSSLKFLPFRNFAPLRNEALSMMTAIVWQQNQSQKLYKDLLIQISNEQLIKRECANLKKNNQKSNPFLTALYFFTILVNTNEDKLIFLMKFEKVFDFLSEFFENNPEFKKYFPILYATVRKQYLNV